MTTSSCIGAFLSKEAGYENFPLKKNPTYKTPRTSSHVQTVLPFWSGRMYGGSWASGKRGGGNGERQQTLVMKVTRHHQRGTKAEELFNLSHYFSVWSSNSPPPHLNRKLPAPGWSHIWASPHVGGAKGMFTGRFHSFALFNSSSDKMQTGRSINH